MSDTDKKIFSRQNKHPHTTWLYGNISFLLIVPVRHLHHLGMDVEAGIAQLSDLLGQELHPLSGVTEDNRLVDLKL